MLLRAFWRKDRITKKSQGSVNCITKGPNVFWSVDGERKNKATKKSNGESSLRMFLGHNRQLQILCPSEDVPKKLWADQKDLCHIVINNGKVTVKWSQNILFLWFFPLHSGYIIFSTLNMVYFDRKVVALV